MDLDVTAFEGYDPNAEDNFTATLQGLKSLKYPLVDDLEQLKDAPIDRIMESLHLESELDEDAPADVRALSPNTSQLVVPVYPKVRDPKNLWVIEREMLLEDALAANISRAEKKKKSRTVCRTHGVGSAHHARSDGVPVSVLVVPRGLQIIALDASTQTEDTSSSPRLVRSCSLPLL